MNELLEKLDEADFGDIFQPAGKEELVAKRGWAQFDASRSEVKPLSTFEEVQEYAKLSESNYKSYYRQGNNFYGVLDKQSKATFLVMVALNKKLTVFDSSGNRVEYFMD